jgi:peptidoglycan/xylan/chitin deacetylase (PgdA/CDA1 family)
MKIMLLTFDYELFLGQRSGSVDCCLINPTNRLLGILNKKNVKGVFFIDTIYLLRLKEISKDNPEARKDFYAISSQLNKINQEGHTIFLHIHSHWYDAKYIQKNNQWDLSENFRYRFSSLKDDERESSIKSSISILKEILLSADLSGIRAGGWSIQPFDSFKPYLQKFGLKYDFSVLPREYFNSNCQKYDFSSISEVIYRFNDIEKPIQSGYFKEFTNSSIKISKISSYISRIENYVTSKLSIGKKFGDGHGLINKNVTRYSNFRLVSIENLNLTSLILIIKKFLKSDYIQFTSHPKLISPLQLFYFRVFLFLCYNKSKVETDFKKIENE